MVIRQIGVGSLAKILAALYAFWGFIFGAILALAALVGAAACSALARSSFCRFCTAFLALSAAR
jgi:hypothetical protein